MKIKVVNKAGEVETIMLSGLLRLEEGGDTAKSCLGSHFGHNHFFTPDGTYVGMFENEEG